MSTTELAVKFDSLWTWKAWERKNNVIASRKTTAQLSRVLFIVSAIFRVAAFTRMLYEKYLCPSCELYRYFVNASRYKNLLGKMLFYSGR